MLKAFKYRVYPDENQKVLLAKHFGCVRWIYNYGLSKKTKAYHGGEKLTCIDIANELPKLKASEETSWLKEVCAQSLQMSLRNLDNAYTNFFKKNADFPRFKSKHDNILSFQCPQDVWVDFASGKTYIPKFKGGIETVFHRKFEGKIKTVTVSKNAANRYFVSVLVEDGLALPVKRGITKNGSVGIDLGIKEFCVLSTGEKIANPRFLNRRLRRLALLQRRHSRKSKGGANREKARIKVARCHQRIANSRKDFLHKLSFRIINDNQVDTVCLENLSVKQMMENPRFSGKIADVGWSAFVGFLKYKAEWVGKNVLVIGQFDPSSQMCSACGNIKPMPVEVRVYECSCGHKEDRDVNAAKNIKRFALVSEHSGKDIAGGSVESSSEQSRVECNSTFETTKKQKKSAAKRRSPRL